MTSDSTFYIDFEADCDSGSPCWHADTEEERNQYDNCTWANFTRAFLDGTRTE